MILIVDIRNLMYRAFWAVPQTLTPQGADITGLHGAIRMTLAMLRQYSSVKHLVVCADPSGETRPNWRYAVFPAYKAGRSVARETSDNRAAHLRRQVQAMTPYVRAFFEHVNCLWLEDDSEEGDDLIAWSAVHLPGNMTRLVVTADWDMLQLVERGNVEIAQPRKHGHYDVFTRANFASSIGPLLKKHIKHARPTDAPRFTANPAPLQPDLYVAFRCMTGDRSDGIPGLHGVAATRAYEIVTAGAALTQSRFAPDIFAAWWRRENSAGLPTPAASRIVRVNPDAHAILARNEKLMRLDVQRIPSMVRSFRGVWAPDVLDRWFSALNLRSFTSTPKGEFHDAFVHSFGRLAHV